MLCLCVVAGRGDAASLGLAASPRPPPRSPGPAQVAATGFGGPLGTAHPARRRRRELVTTMTLEDAMAAPAIMGLSSPAMASGMAATL